MRQLILLIIILNIQSCAAPIIGGVGAVALSSSAQEKGIGTSINDKVIYLKLRNAIYEWNSSVSEKISISVDNGSILITGQLEDIKTKIDLTQIQENLEYENQSFEKNQTNRKNMASILIFGFDGKVQIRKLAKKGRGSLSEGVLIRKRKEKVRNEQGNSRK